MTLTFRPARLEDEGWLWHLANDAGVRAASLSTAPIPAAEHAAWLAHFLQSAAIHRVMERDGVPVGWARVEADATVSVALFPGARGRGWGTPLIRLVTTLAHERGWVPRATIRPGNIASRRAFEAAGYTPTGVPDVYHAR